jgi:phospholipase/carboxylesterase
MRKNYQYGIILIVMLLAAMACFGQNTGEKLNPEQIDIYTYDPLPQLQSNTVGYSAAAQKYYNEGKFELAAKYYLAYLADYPDDATAWYNLSCCYGLLGSAKEAAQYLKISYKKGFTDLQHISRDKDFDKVKDAKTFTLALDSLKIWNDKEAFYKGKMNYFKSEQYVPYWIQLPKDFDAKKEYTLLIGLHGFGDKAQNFSSLWSTLSTGNVIYVVPEAPFFLQEGRDAGFSWMPFVEMSDKKVETSYAMLSEYLVELTQSLEKKYNIKQTWLLGFSQGAYYGYLLTLGNSKVFDGAVLCGGGLMAEKVTSKQYKAAKARKTQFIISHGKNDQVVPFSEAQKAYDTLQGKGLKVTLLDFEGGHQVSEAALRDWLDRVK